MGGSCKIARGECSAVWGRLGMGRRSGEVKSGVINRTRAWLSIAGSISLVPLLSGCILGTEKPEIAVEIPPAYRYADRKPNAALPTYQWWRKFRSREITALVEEAQQ